MRPPSLFLVYQGLKFCIISTWASPAHADKMETTRDATLSFKPSRERVHASYLGTSQDQSEHQISVLICLIASGHGVDLQASLGGPLSQQVPNQPKEEFLVRLVFFLGHNPYDTSPMEIQ